MLYLVSDHEYFEVLERYTLAFNISIASFILIFCKYLLHIHYAPDAVLGTGCSVREGEITISMSMNRVNLAEEDFSSIIKQLNV